LDGCSIVTLSCGHELLTERLETSLGDFVAGGQTDGLASVFDSGFRICHGQIKFKSVKHSNHRPIVNGYFGDNRESFALPAPLTESSLIDSPLMSRKSRLILIVMFATLCGGLGLGIVTLNSYERKETAEVLEQIQIQRAYMLDQITELQGESLNQFIYEYGQWTEVVDFLAADTPDLDWAEDNIHSALVVFNAKAAWFFRPDGQLYYSLDADTFHEGRAPPPIPFELVEPHFRENQNLHFYYELEGELYEIRGSWVEHSSGLVPESNAKGYLLIGRKWDAAYLKRLSVLTDSQVTFDRQRHSQEHQKPDAFNFHIHRELPSIDGEPLGVLDIYYNSAELELLIESDHWETVIFLAYGFLVILVVMIFAQHWVLRPLSKIKASLALGKIEPVNYLLKDDAEFGQIARLVRQSFSDQGKLTASLDERARLGRDLHDGVIQTLYATGMTMTSIRRHIRQKPEVAEELIDQTRSELKATIRDVRHFISRLEPEDAVSLSFEDAVTSLLEFMQGGRDINFTTNVDTHLADEIPVEIRANLLQIIREATSNAIRHGECRNITVTLISEQDKIRLEIADDGKGFCPVEATKSGLGIHNFHERAQELHAALDIDSQPNHGARIIFLLPLFSKL